MNPFRTIVPLTVALGLVAVAPAGARTTGGQAGGPTARAAQAAAGDEVVLPARVNAAIRRTQNALGNAENHIDEGEYAKAVISLRAVRTNVYRADRAARHQMNAVPADPEAETTPGPDSVIAVLGLEHEVIVGVSGLFDTTSKGVVDGLTHAMFRTLGARNRLLDAVIALDPEGAGAAYADGMPDTATDYTDEVDGLTEALHEDRLSAGGRRVLTPALASSQAAANRFNAAFGGGE